MVTGTRLGGETLDCCPWSPSTAQTTGVALHLASWWADWKKFGLLPFGSDTLADEPAVVYDVLAAAESESDQVQIDRMERTKKEK